MLSTHQDWYFSITSDRCYRNDWKLVQPALSYIPHHTTFGPICRGHFGIILCPEQEMKYYPHLKVLDTDHAWNSDPGTLCQWVGKASLTTWVKIQKTDMKAPLLYISTACTGNCLANQPCNQAWSYSLRWFHMPVKKVNWFELLRCIAAVILSYLRVFVLPTVVI